jgi:glycosyltransferase involved in cell wall biosynthesis
MVANSEYVRAKIKRAYGRDSVVIYPPVDVSGLEAIATHAGYYLIVSRLVRYKGVDFAIEACKRRQRKLIIVGEGPDRSRLEELARGGNVHFAGRVSESELRKFLQECRAFIFPGQEDFGIAPVEAQGWGKPVIAFGQGGALETVIPDETGVFFTAQTADSLAGALQAFEERTWDAEKIRRNALRFSAERFETEMRALVGRHLNGAGSAVAESP